MRTALPWRFIILLSALLLLGQNVQSFAVPSGPSIDEIFQQSDIIFKGTVLEDNSTKDPHVTITTFKIISLFLGPPSIDRVNFQHANSGISTEYLLGWSSKYYEFTVGKTYLVCAKHTDTTGLYQQLWTNPTTTDNTVTPCADDHPFTLKSFPEALCVEMIGNLAQANADSTLYSIRQLNRLSGGAVSLWEKKELTFDRKTVMAGLWPFLTNPDPRIAQEAMRVIGSESPYLSDEATLDWLNARAAVKIVNVGVRDPKKTNAGGYLCRLGLLSVANGKADADTRATAIASLGLLSDPTIAGPLTAWLTDPSPAVRRSATLLLSDYPALATREQLSALIKDKAPEVRSAAAMTMGIQQQPENADLIARLLDDPDVEVRQAAVASLVTFSPKDGKLAAIFHANVDRSEFAPIFFNALAQDDPATHLDGLTKVVAHNTEPDNPWIGETPHILAWEILLTYLKAQPPEQLKSGKFDSALDALGKVNFVEERMDVNQTRGLHPYPAPGLAKLEVECNLYNICVPAIVYAFYLQHGMPDRAKKFHLWSMKAIPQFADDLDALYDIVSENPSSFVR